jgi:hypothetical protein
MSVNECKFKEENSCNLPISDGAVTEFDVDANSDIDNFLTLFVAIVSK